MAQLVEHNLAKVGVAGSNPVVRSKETLVRNRIPAALVDRGMAIYDKSIASLDGSPFQLSDFKGKTTLIVNVASKCGLTPQYEGLEKLHEQYKNRGFSVVGVPCNQFGAQEPGSADEIATFCSTTYGVTFPMFEKIEVNGPGRHPIYVSLTETPDAKGEAGDIQWNFEKFLVSPDGEVVARFRPGVEPEDAQIVAAVEAALPGTP